MRLTKPLLHRYLAARHDVKLFAFTRQYPRRLFPDRTDRDTTTRFRDIE